MKLGKTWERNIRDQLGPKYCFGFNWGEFIGTHCIWRRAWFLGFIPYWSLIAKAGPSVIIVWNREDGEELAKLLPDHQVVLD